MTEGLGFFFPLFLMAQMWQVPADYLKVCLSLGKELAPKELRLGL